MLNNREAVLNATEERRDQSQITFESKRDAGRRRSGTALLTGFHGRHGIDQLPRVGFVFVTFPCEIFMSDRRHRRCMYRRSNRSINNVSGWEPSRRRGGKMEKFCRVICMSGCEFSLVSAGHAWFLSQRRKWPGHFTAPSLFPWTAARFPLIFSLVARTRCRCLRILNK